MRVFATCRPLLLGALLAAPAWFTESHPAASAQTDLDALMSRVLARRDDNWTKLQQYILDEREAIDVRGPDRAPFWGEQREFTWYIRDGFFVRSPVRVNGATISEGDRRKYESEFLRREQLREKRARGEAPTASASPADQPPQSLDGLIQQTRQPQFVSSAYFLRFKFEQGRYAFVGREQLNGRDVLKVEYYPERLFENQPSERRRSAPPTATEREVQRLMSKVALITLWIEPEAQQIVKYTFDNIGFDFLPGQWLFQVNDARATMTMSQPFENVWLPRDVDVRIGVALAVGQFDLTYRIDYQNYRRAEVTSKIGIPKP
jgi:hypothetical protein